MLKRAAVLIGVDKTGDLPKLKDAARGARLMEAWTRAQGIETAVVTDEADPVTIYRIKNAIKALTKDDDVSQLLVYFAGHGVNLQRQEYWLLSDAPEDTQAAVNVATSAALAATCGIPHIVFISDACRTAPEGVRAQSVRGSEIFPNREEDMHPVDQFFACQLGKPSHEVRDPTVTSSEFFALYTQELVPALLGKREQIIEWAGSSTARTGFVHLRPLRDYLSSAVASRLVDLQMETKVIQVPVAQISSDPPAWISQISAATALQTRGRGVRRTRPRMRPIPPVASPQGATTQLLREAMAAGQSGLTALASKRTTTTRGGGGGTRGPQPMSAVAALAASAQQLAQPFGPEHHETACGFKLRGARAADAVGASIHISFSGAEPAQGDDLRVGPQPPASNVLLVLDSGAGVLLPAIPDFLCALTFDNDGELIDVSYEPSHNTCRWDVFRERASEIRALRAIAAAATSSGSFKLDGDNALAIARRMQLAKGVDPSLSIYAGYAYHDLQRRDLLRQMADYLQDDLGAPFFDVALLARRLYKAEIGPASPPFLLGAVPLMAQGWTLLRAFEVRLPPSLAALENHRLPSLWTMFDAKGVDRIRRAFSQGELR